MHFTKAGGESYYCMDLDWTLEWALDSNISILLIAGQMVADKEKVKRADPPKTLKYILGPFSSISRYDQYLRP